MSRRDDRVDAIDLCQAGETSRQVDDFECGSARLGGALPCDQHSERRRVELRKRRAIDAARSRRNTLQASREHSLRARMGQRGAGFEAARH